MPNLQGFLTTGKLGEITTGLSKEYVRKILGDPADISVQKNPEIWNYGALHLSFYKGRTDPEPLVIFMVLTFFNEDVFPEPLTTTDWMPSGKTTFAEFKEYLAKSNLLGSADISEVEYGNATVTMKSGVEVDFMDGKLWGINLAAHRKAPGRQLSVFIPEQVLDLVRREAAARKVSMSALCAQWITEQAAKLCESGLSQTQA